MQRKDYSKKDLRNYLNDLITGKIKTLDFYREFTLEASRDLKKTPKYDSFREEMQEEIYHLDKQKHSLLQMKKDMLKVLPRTTTEVQVGSVVITNKARFYISVGVGEIFFEGDRFYAISPESPMAKTLAGKKVGDEFTLNNIYQKIELII